MLVFYQAALTLCVVFLVGTTLSLAAAYRSGNKRQIRMLHLLRLGLILSACSYELRIQEPLPLGHVSFFSFFFCLSGTALIWLGYRAHGKMQKERRDAVPPSGAKDRDLNPATSSLVGPAAGFTTPDLWRAAGAAIRSGRRLLPLTALCRHGAFASGSAADAPGHRHSDAGLSGVSLEKVHLELLEQIAPSRKFAEKSPAGIGRHAQAKPAALTEGARQVFFLAAQEAHRFDETSIGTEHLLLGLMLMGRGKAASVLFREGVTVDGLRNEIIKAKKAAGDAKP